jgi:aldose 1-epimerase
VARIVIESANLCVGLRHDLGGGLDSLTYRRNRDEPWTDVLRPARADAAWFNDLACYTMLPWSNRIAAGMFEFRGTRRVVKPDWPDGTAIHGCVKAAAWTILDRSPMSARLEYEHAANAAWPWAFRAVQRVEADDHTLRLSVEITNHDKEAMPAGCGFHPFFRREIGVAASDTAGAGAEHGTQASAAVNATLHVSAALRGRYPATKMIPTGPAAMDDATRHIAARGSLESLELDDVFLLDRSVGDGVAGLEWLDAAGTGRLRMRMNASPEFGHLVIYNAREDASREMRPFVCVEPVTMVNDGFNLLARDQAETGVRVLEPGESLRVGTDWVFEMPT